MPWSSITLATALFADSGRVIVCRGSETARSQCFAAMSKADRSFFVAGQETPRSQAGAFGGKRNFLYVCCGFLTARSQAVAGGVVGGVSHRATYRRRLVSLGVNEAENPKSCS